MERDELEIAAQCSLDGTVGYEREDTGSGIKSADDPLGLRAPELPPLTAERDDHMHGAAASVGVLADMMERIQAENPQPELSEAGKNGMVTALEVAHRAAVFYVEALMSGAEQALSVGVGRDEHGRPLFIKLVAVDDIGGTLATRTERVVEYVPSPDALRALASLAQRNPEATRQQLVDRAVISAAPVILTKQ
jgi:hypothetical protein